MLPVLLEAHDEHEEQVAALWQTRELMPPLDVWARAFGPDVPKAAFAIPHVAVEAGRVTGTITVRRLRLHLQGDLHDSQVLFSPMVEEGASGLQAVRLFLERFPQRTPISLAIGWPADGVKALREFHWHFIAPFTRWRLMPKRKSFFGKLPPEPKPGVLPPGFGKAVEQRMAGEGAVCLARLEPYEQWLAKAHEGHEFALYPVGGMAGAAVADGFMRVVRRPGAVAGAYEWHLADLRCPPAVYTAAAAALSTLVQSTQQPLFADFLAPGFARALGEVGAEPLPARRGVFAAIGPEGDSSWFADLHGESPIHLFPADGDLDLDL